MMAKTLWDRGIRGFRAVSDCDGLVEGNVAMMDGDYLGLVV